MSDLGLELQGAIVSALKSDAALSVLVDERVFDLVPASATYPLVSYGETQVIRADVTCISSFVVYVTLHAWSMEVGFPQVRQVSGAVEQALHDAPLTLPSYRLISIRHRQTRVFRDSDGLSSHGVIDLVAYVEAA